MIAYYALCICVSSKFKVILVVTFGQNLARLLVNSQLFPLNRSICVYLTCLCTVIRTFHREDFATSGFVIQSGNASSKTSENRVTISGEITCLD